jgi:long-chain acyl-CoA synthetase
MYAHSVTDGLAAGSVAGPNEDSLHEDSPPATLPEVLLRRTGRHPDAPFILTLPDDPAASTVSRTYAGVTTSSIILASALAEAGVAPGDTIGCYFSNSPGWVVASFAVWWHRCVVAAVGTLVPPEEAARLFELAGVRLVLTEQEPGPGRQFEEIRVDSEGQLSGRDAKEFVHESGIPNLQPPPPQSAATIFFTSGTTGRSKGITHTHAACLESGRIVAAAYARRTGYRPDAAPAHLPPGVVFSPFGHAAGYGRLAFRMWIGRPSLLVPKFSVKAVSSLLARFEIDSLHLSPAMVHMLATTSEDLSLGDVSYVTSGTAPLSVTTRDRFESRYGIPVIQAYGTTEAGTIAQERLQDVLDGRRGPGSVGRIAAGVEVRIRPLEENTADESRPRGEVMVRNDRLPSTFVGGQAAPVDEDGWFATGDVGYLDENGILCLTGRLQERLIVGGFNVYPAEVEDVLRKSDLVADAVVVGLEDERLGERPVAGVVWSGRPDRARLIAEVRKQLAHYKVPRYVFTLQEIPLTARDKVDRRRATTIAIERLGGTVPPSR